MEEKKEQKVELSMDDYKALIERLNKVEKGQGVVKPKWVNEHVAYVRLVDKRPVVRVGSVYTENKGTPQEIDLFEVYVLDDNKEVKKVVPYLEFLNTGDRVQVKILKQTAKEYETSQGWATNDGSLDKRKAGETIELIVKNVDYESEVEFLEGELSGTTLKVPNTALNI